jgi:hypothetical protein
MELVKFESCLDFWGGIIDTARKQKINEFEALRDIVASKSVFGLG